MEKQQPAATAAPAVPLRNGFVPRGNFAALPLAFPSVSTPIPADSSRVTALACRREPGACVFGATSGRETRVFLAGVRPPHGYVLELAVLPEAREATAVSLLPGGAPRRWS